jgi:riboflavin kinase/FMN adenylyltransferase
MHFFHGRVVRGDKRGGELGYKTANLSLPQTIFKPKNGVYACYVEIESDGVYREAIMNCGVRPTFDNSKRIQVEAHIYDFSEEIYDTQVKVFLLSFLREEKKFSSLEALKAQISLDIQESKKYFKENSKSKTLS